MLLERGESDYFLGAYTVNLIAVEMLLAVAFLVVMLVTWPNPPWDALQYGGVVLSIIGLCYVEETAIVTASSTPIGDNDKSRLSHNSENELRSDRSLAQFSVIPLPRRRGWQWT